MVVTGERSASKKIRRSDGDIAKGIESDGAIVIQVPETVLYVAEGAAKGRWWSCRFACAEHAGQNVILNSTMWGLLASAT